MILDLTLKFKNGKILKREELLVEKVKLSTGERLLSSAIDLIAEKGYNAVTTKEIAREASVSEMTLFRHFGTKRKILEEAIDRYYYAMPMQELFENNIVWDLQQDLYMISKSYHDIMKKNRRVILIAFKDGKTIPGLYDQINRHPRQLKELIIDYLEEMERRRKIKKYVNLENIAMAYLYMLYGEFVSRNFVEGHQITSIKENDFIHTTVLLFVEALTNN